MTPEDEVKALKAEIRELRAEMRDLYQRQQRQGVQIDNLTTNLKYADTGFQKMWNHMDRFSLHVFGVPLPEWDPTADDEPEDEEGEPVYPEDQLSRWCPICATEHPLSEFDMEHHPKKWIMCVQRLDEFQSIHGPFVTKNWIESLYRRQRTQRLAKNWRWQVSPEELRKWGLKPRDQQTDY